MDATPVQTAERDDAGMTLHFRRNYLAHGIDGGLFMGGLAFVDSQTVLPRMVESLGGPNWVIALTPVLMMVGMMGPQILVAHRIERLARMKPLLLVTGVLQRLPYLAAGLVLLLPGEALPAAALVAIVAAPLLSGLSGGISAAAWQELVAKTIPGRRLSSLWAVRLMISALIGILAGWVVTRVLAAFPGTEGYGILHLLVFAFLAVSFAVFTLIRETAIPPKRSDDRAAWIAFVRSVPGAIRADRRLALWLATRILLTGIFILVPFLGIHALHVLQRPDSYLGNLIVPQMVGVVVGNFVGGYLGDRWGGKLVMALSHIGFVALSAWAALGTGEWGFTAIFFLLGLSFALGNVGTPTLGLEIAPVEKRVAYIAITGFFTLAGFLSASLASSLIRNRTEAFVWLAVPAGAMVAASLCLLMLIREPRGRQPAVALRPGA